MSQKSTTPQPRNLFPGTRSVSTPIRIFLILLSLGIVAFCVFFAVRYSSKSTVQRAAHVTVVPPIPTPTPARICPKIIIGTTSNNYGVVTLNYTSDCQLFIVHFRYSRYGETYDAYWKVRPIYSKVALSVSLGDSSWTLWIILSARGMEQLAPGIYNRIQAPYNATDSSTFLADPPSADYPPGWPPVTPSVPNPFDWENVWWPGWRILVAGLIGFAITVEVYKKVKKITKKMNRTLVIWGFICIAILALTCLGWYGEIGYYFQHLFTSSTPVIPVQLPVSMQHS